MALRLGDRRVNAVMTPRTQLEWLDLQDDPEENRRKVRESDYSRFPVFDGGPQQVAGIVQVKDILTAEMSGKPFDLKPLVQPAMFIPETATALRALEMFRKSGEPMELVVDEFGDLQGAVTLTDILQSLVGDIAEPGELSSPSIERRPDGSFIVDGMTPLDQVHDLLTSSARVTTISAIITRLAASSWRVSIAFLWLAAASCSTACNTRSSAWMAAASIAC